MSVDASMMTNLIQVTNLQCDKKVTRDVSTSSDGSNESKFNQLLTSVTEQSTKPTISTKVEKNVEIVESTEMPVEAETITKEALIQFITNALESLKVEGTEEDEKLSALLELLLESANKMREEQLETDQNPEVEEAMSLLSMLMNMGNTTLTQENFTEVIKNVTFDSSSSLEVSMMQMEGRLNQLLTTMNEETKESSQSMLEMLMQASKNEQTTQKVEEPTVNEQPVIVEETMKSMVTPVQTQPSKESKEVETPVIQVVENVQGKDVQQETTSNKDMFTTNTPKEVVVEESKSNQHETQESTDFEKAYNQMQAYRMNANTTTVKEVVPTEVEEVVEVNKSDILNQISENMKSVNEIQDEYVIKLKPEGLGEIVVKLQSESNGKSILSLIVNNESVKNILESDLNGLKAALSETNVEVKEVVYDDNSQYFQQSNFMEGNNFYQERENSATSQTFNYQFDIDEMDQIQEEEFLHDDSIIHQHI